MLDYREFIKNEINLSKKINNKFNYSFFAERAGVQNTYFSKVLKLEAHLNSDQIFLLSDALELKEKEREYLGLLHEHSRSVINKRKSALNQRIKALEREFEKLEEHLIAKTVAPEKNTDLARYYLNPFNTLVHIFLTVPYFSKNPLRIAESLRLSETELESILYLLVDLKIIAPDGEGGGFKVLQEALHLSKESIFTNPHHTLMRYRCLDRITNLPAEKKKNFSVTFSADEKTRKEIYEEFLKFASKIEKMVGHAASEEVYQLNFDFFPWS